MSNDSTALNASQTISTGTPQSKLKSKYCLISVDMANLESPSQSTDFLKDQLNSLSSQMTCPN